MKQFLMRSAWAVTALGLCATAAARGLIPEPNAHAVPYATQANPETLLLDASTAGRGFATSTMRIPVEPGPFTFVYPKWIPGEHGPTGPLADISQLKVSADGKPLAWRRDKVDMYAFHVTVPEGVHTLNVLASNTSVSGLDCVASGTALAFGSGIRPAALDAAHTPSEAIASIE